MFGELARRPPQVWEPKAVAQACISAKAWISGGRNPGCNMWAFRSWMPWDGGKCSAGNLRFSEKFENGGNVYFLWTLDPRFVNNMFLKDPTQRQIRMSWHILLFARNPAQARAYETIHCDAYPRTPFSMLSSHAVRQCRISVIQLLCFGDKYSLPMLSREHECQDSKCFYAGFVPSTVCRL